VIRKISPLSLDAFGLFVIAQRNEPAMPKMIVRRPFHELELADQLGL